MKTFLGISLLAVTLAVAVITSAEGSVPAPDTPAPSGKAFRHARMAVIAQRLGLTDVQKASFKDLRSQTAAAVRGIRENNTLTAEQKQAQIDFARNAARDQMRTLLTDDQRARLAEIRSHPRLLNARAFHRMRMAMVARRLGLTPEQRASIREIQAKTVAAMRPVRADASLASEARREKVRQLVQASRTEIRGILTPKQQTRLERMRHRLLAPLGPLG